MKWQGWHLGFWLILKTNTWKQHDQTHGELLCTIWWHSTSILTLNFVEQNFHWWKVDSAQLAWIPVIRPLFSFQSSNMTGDSRLFPKCSKYIDLLMGFFFQHAEQWRWLQKLIQIIAVTTGWYYLAGAFAKHDSQSSSLFPKFWGQNISKRDCGPAPNVTSLITCSSIFSLPPVLLWSSWMYTPENKHDNGKNMVNNYHLKDVSPIKNGGSEFSIAMFVHWRTTAENHHA